MKVLSISVCLLIGVMVNMLPLRAISSESVGVGDPLPVFAVDQADPVQVFKSAGRNWRLLKGYRAFREAQSISPSEGIDTQISVAGRRLFRSLRARSQIAGSARVDGDQGLLVAWDSRRRQYGLITGEVVVYTEEGHSQPDIALPEGLTLAREFPELGMTIYHLTTDDLSVVDVFAGSAGVKATEIIVKTQEMRLDDAGFRSAD